jgi:putative Holliday junction resolvase
MTILALDVGAQRIGVATANIIARIASPLVTIPNNESIVETIQQLIAENDVEMLIVGLPRGLDGQETAQTQTVRDFVSSLQQAIGDFPMQFQDEALTSRKAEEELEARGKPYQKGDIDALAATYILDDYLQENAGAIA